MNNSLKRKKARGMKSSRGHNIICVDLGGTLCNEVCFTIKEVENATLNKKNARMVEEYYLNDYVIVYTARRDELLPATLKWLRINNIRYHAISNLKIPASIYFDDKARKA